MYESACQEWEDLKRQIEDDNNQIDKRNKRVLDDWQKSVEEWERKKAAFYAAQVEYNEKIDHLKAQYSDQQPEAVVEYCEMVLNNSVYPEEFPRNFLLEYNPENKILVIEYSLPPLEAMPTIKDVKYVASKRELKESYISESQLNQMYDDAIYQITLRTLHELFEADVAGAICAISFNGWVDHINKATGKEESKCIVSVQVKKEEFIDISLGNVDPKACFKSLKGVAGSKLNTLTAIQPILQITKTDKRFIDGVGSKMKCNTGPLVRYADGNPL